VAIGAAGSAGRGKGTQAELLTERLGACHLSTGDVFRAASKRKDCDQSPAMVAALDYMRRGELVPDSTVWRWCASAAIAFSVAALHPRRISTHARAGGIAERVDGDGKHCAQRGGELRTAVDEIVERLSGRRTCEQCKAVFTSPNDRRRRRHLRPLRRTLYQREDDRPESITVRLEAYERSTAPLIQFYRNLEC